MAKKPGPKQATDYTPCPYIKVDCCMRDGRWRCMALTDVQFHDGVCHFRKTEKYGPNLYDEGRKKWQK